MKGCGSAAVWWRLPPVGNFCFLRKNLGNLPCVGKRIDAILYSQASMVRTLTPSIGGQVSGQPMGPASIAVVIV